MSTSVREQLAALGGTFGSCARKVQYPSRQRAESVAEKRMRAVPERLHVYRCMHCDGWHITRMEQQ
jgi:hypothetical protein